MLFNSIHQKELRKSPSIFSTDVPLFAKGYNHVNSEVNRFHKIYGSLGCFQRSLVGALEKEFYY